MKSIFYLSQAKIQKYNVTLGPARPLNVEKSSLESVEERVNRLELEERARFMDLGGNHICKFLSKII